jgi:hypothetical protein
MRKGDLVRVIGHGDHLFKKGELVQFRGMDNRFERTYRCRNRHGLVQFVEPENIQKLKTKSHV